MAALHDFLCKTCDRFFEDVSDFNPNIGTVDPKECPLCGTLSGRVWLQAPGIEADEYIPAEERAAARTQLGVDPQTRSELKRIKNERNLTEISASEFERNMFRAPKSKPFEFDKQRGMEIIEKNIAKRRAGELPDAPVSR